MPAPNFVKGVLRHFETASLSDHLSTTMLPYYCAAVVLLYCCANGLQYYCAAMLLCQCTGVILCCSATVLLCFSALVLLWHSFLCYRHSYIQNTEPLLQVLADLKSLWAEASNYSSRRTLGTCNANNDGERSCVLHWLVICPT